MGFFTVKTEIGGQDAAELAYLFEEIFFAASADNERIANGLNIEMVAFLQF